MNFRRVSVLSCIVAIALCAEPAVAQQSASSPGERKLGSSLELQTVDGKTLNVRRLRGKVVLVDFMTTVCPTCRLASACLQNLYDDLAPKGFQAVAVALNVDSTPPLKHYIREHGLTFVVGTASRDAVATYLSHPADKLMYVPTLVLLDRKGRICAVETGWKGEEAWRRQITKLLAE